MYRILQYLLAFGFCLSTCVTAGTTAHADSERFVKRKLVRLARILEMTQPKKRTASLLNELQQSFDYPQFESKVLVDSHSKFTAAQKTRFSKAFQTLFERKLIALADDPAMRCEDYSVSEGKRADEINVTCIQGQSSETMLLHFAPNKKNKIVDLTFSGALLSRNYRGVINKIIRKDGIDALILKLETQPDSSLTKKTLL